MIDTELLHRRLDEADNQDTTERALLSLLHASFEDDGITFRYSKPDDVNYPKQLIDAGRFVLDEYTVERQREDSYRINLRASYDDMIPEEVEGADFHAPLAGTVVYDLTVKCGPKVHTGQVEVLVIPDWRKA